MLAVTKLCVTIRLTDRAEPRPPTALMPSRGAEERSPPEPFRPKSLVFDLRLSRLADEVFQRVDHLAKLVDHPVVDALGVHLKQRPVVPQVLLRVLHAEPLPQLVTMRAEVPQDCMSVVQFVGQRHQSALSDASDRWRT